VSKGSQGIGMTVPWLSTPNSRLGIARKNVNIVTVKQTALVLGAEAARLGEHQPY
jgi:hypothetical protein